MSDLKQMYKTIQADPFPEEMRLTLGDQELVFAKRTWTIENERKGLRYGENPDQPAALYELKSGQIKLGGVALRGPGQGLVASLNEEHMLQAGKHPGKINLTDVDNGINILQYLTAKPAAVILKHNNPCGAAWQQDSLYQALQKAFHADRIAAFGGTIVVNRLFDLECAQFISNLYFEVVAAPEFSPEALTALKKKKNLRILQLPGLLDLKQLTKTPFLDLKSLTDGGIIAQFSFQNRIGDPQDFLPAQAADEQATLLARKPNAQETDDLIFAWAVEAGVTSNSVIFVKDGATLAIGTGEQDRVGCVQLAIHKAYTKYADNLAFTRHGLSLYELQRQAADQQELAGSLTEINELTARAKGGLLGSVLVSDGFFPFRDGVDLAIAEGITAIAQPGGSIRDKEVISATLEASPQVAMVFTGQRSFRH